MPVGRSLVISRTTFSVYKRPVIIPNSAGSSGGSCAHETQKCLQLGYRVSAHPSTSHCAQPLCCHPAQHGSGPPVCLSPRWADCCKSEQCLQGPCEHSLCPPAEWGKGRCTETIIPELTLHQARSPGRALPPCEAVTTCLRLCCF